MKFHLDGPDVPDELIAAQERGEAIFLCGAGVSRSAGLPGFGGLVAGVYARLNERLEDHPVEHEAFQRQEFDRVLRILERRLVGADVRQTASLRPRIRAAVSAQLSVGKGPFTRHAAILRLSRNKRQAACVATTNFDPLFERAARDLLGETVQSHAGVALPAPDTARFEGVLHVHGRIADAELGLDETDWVLTSAEFGDAYLRSGWASRWVYDLLRTSTVVLVGYSADDPPMRYLLEALDADRERYPDLRDVYAFVGVKPGEEKHAEQLWEAKGAKPILYRSDADEDHDRLYTTLSTWGDYAAAPAAWRRAKVGELLARSPQDVSADELAWLHAFLSAPTGAALLHDFNPDPAWLSPLAKAGVFGPGLATFGAWAALRIAEPKMIRAVAGQPPLEGGDRFAIRRACETAPTPLPEILALAWRAILAQRRDATDWDLRVHLIEERLRGGDASAEIRDQILRSLNPRLTVSQPYHPLSDDAADAPALYQLANLDFEPRGAEGELDVGSAWSGPPVATADLLRRTIGGMLDALEVAEDYGFAGGVYDLSSHDVPSIARHPQNEYRSGFYPITRLAADLWSKLAEGDPDAARAEAVAWRRSRFVLLRRLHLHALADPVFTPKEAADGLIALDDQEFWDSDLRRESMRLLGLRWPDFPAAARQHLERRLRAGPPPELYEHLTEDARPDLEAIRDHAAFVRLHRIVGSGGAVSVATTRALARLQKAHPQWETGSGDRDDFGSWGETRTGHTADVGLLADVKAADLVDRALQIEAADRWKQGGLWASLCAADPGRAVLALQADLGAGRARDQSLRDLLNAQIPGQGVAVSDGVAALLLAWPQAQLTGGLLHLAALWLDRAQRPADISPDLTARLGEVWWRLAPLVFDGEDDGGPAADDEAQILGAPAALLADTLLARLRGKFEPGSGLPASERKAFDTAVEATGRPGRMARALFTTRLSFLHWLDPAWTELHLVPKLDWSSAEAASAWKMQSNDHVGSPALFALIRAAWLAAVVRPELPQTSANGLIDGLLAILLSDAENPEGAQYELAASDVRLALEQGSEALREHAAWWLWRRLHDQPVDERAAAWRDQFKPIFDKIWPVAAALQTRGSSSRLIAMAITAEDAFPEALEDVLPLIVSLPGPRGGEFHHLNTGAPNMLARFPDAAFKLIDALITTSGNPPYELTSALDQLEAAKPALRQDPRFQRLRRIATH